MATGATPAGLKKDELIQGARKLPWATHQEQEKTQSKAGQQHATVQRQGPT
jgi:hypothetical protein